MSPMDEILTVRGIPVRVIRSERRTLSLEVRPDGQARVRAPARLSKDRIRAFLAERSGWLESHVRTALERSARAGAQPVLNPAQLRELIRREGPELTRSVERYARTLGVTYGRITLRHAKSRWGSCSAKGNLSFNVALLLAPPEVRDSVVAHELCHRKVMDHSDRFYRLLYSVCPDYDRIHGWLKEHGAELMARVGTQT